MNNMFEKFPFSAVVAEERGDGISITVGKREYGFSNVSVLPSTVVSYGESVLDGPMRIVMEENGMRSELGCAELFLMGAEDREQKEVAATSASDSFYINTVTRVESDGFIHIDLRVMPRGLTVAELFGMDKTRERRYGLDKLWIEIPVKASSAICYQNYPRCNVRRPDGTLLKKSGYLSTGDFVYEGTACYPFLAQLFLTGARTGIAVVAESGETWQPISPSRVVETEKCGEVVILRIRLLDSQPHGWVIEEPERDVNAFKPISFEIGMQVTPLRDYPENPYTERSVHIDCFKKIASNYEDYLSAPFVKDDGTQTGEICFDRLARLGVNTLYLHEKWNDMQNSTRLTARSEGRLKYIVKEAHARGMRVVPYFGYELSSLSPEWAENFAEAARVSGGAMWNRVPYQRCTPICMKSRFATDFPMAVGRLMDKFGFDGVYLDTAICPNECSNIRHGCGYIGQDGKAVPTYPVFSVRRIMKELYREVHLRGGFINHHTCASYNLAALAYGDSIWEGEMTQLGIFNEGLTAMPEGIYRAQFDGRIFGMPLFMLAYTKAPVWTHEYSTAFALLHGTVHKPNDADLPLESTSRIWSLIDSFPIEKACFRYYYETDLAVTANHRDVRISYFEADGELLAFVVNVSSEPAEDTVIFADGVITDAFDTERRFDKKTPPQTLEGFGYRIYRITML